MERRLAVAGLVSLLSLLAGLLYLLGPVPFAKRVDASPSEEVALEKNDRPAAPQCYSSPAADPSGGAWKKCERGVQDSPAYTGDLTGIWSGPQFLRCKDKWEKNHPGEGPRPYWMWEPSDCTLDEPDATKFCRVMEGRKGLLFAGDSLTQEYMAATLAAVLRAEVVESESSQFSTYFSACGGELRFASKRNDFLETRETEFVDMHCEAHDHDSTRCVPFATDEILAEFDTLVVNSGAHRMSGGMEAYRSQMKNSSEDLSASMMRLHGDDAILVARNTVPGHWECDNRTFEEPVSLEVATTLIEEGPPKYGWTTFAEKNQILEDAFEAASGDWKIIDAYTPTLHRADSHRGKGDCLHYCIEGPIDHWIVLLYNILLVETSAR